MLSHMQKINHPWAQTKKTQNVSQDASAQSPSIASNSINNISPSNNFRRRMERVKSILSKDERKDQQLVWYLLHKERKPEKNPHCKALRCKKEVLPGNLCVFVRGLEVPYQQAFAVQSNFYFCPQLVCVQQISDNSWQGFNQGRCFRCRNCKCLARCSSSIIWWLNWINQACSYINKGNLLY